MKCRLGVRFRLDFELNRAETAVDTRTTLVSLCRSRRLRRNIETAVIFRWLRWKRRFRIQTDGASNLLNTMQSMKAEN